MDQHFEIIYWDINKLDYVSSLKYQQQSNLIIAQTYSNIAVGVAGCIPQTKKLEEKHMEALPCHRLVLYEVKWNESFDMVGYSLLIFAAPTEVVDTFWGQT